MGKGVSRKFSDYCAYEDICFDKFHIPLKFSKTKLKIDLKIELKERLKLS
jgi:hypothetical protein